MDTKSTEQVYKEVMALSETLMKFLYVQMTEDIKVAVTALAISFARACAVAGIPPKEFDEASACEYDSFRAALSKLATERGFDIGEPKPAAEPKKAN